jgi:hypothetical protein
MSKVPCQIDRTATILVPLFLLPAQRGLLNSSVAHSGQMNSAAVIEATTQRAQTSASQAAQRWVDTNNDS